MLRSIAFRNILSMHYLKTFVYLPLTWININNDLKWRQMKRLFLRCERVILYSNWFVIDVWHVWFCLSFVILWLISLIFGRFLVKLPDGFMCCFHKPNTHILQIFVCTQRLKFRLGWSYLRLFIGLFSLLWFNSLMKFDQ